MKAPFETRSHPENLSLVLSKPWCGPQAEHSQRCMTGSCHVASCFEFPDGRESVFMVSEGHGTPY